MRFISIGGACNVKYQIDKHNGKSETNFFDWLMTDIKSIIKILSSYKNIKKILHFDNICKNPKVNSHTETNTNICIKSLSFCESIHDVELVFTDADIDEFIEKYLRRFERLIDYIKQNDMIYFIKYGVIAKKDKLAFIKIIKRINPQCKFVIVSLCNDNMFNKYLLREDNYLSLNIYNYKISEFDNNDWKTDCWDWKKLFTNIPIYYDL
jgi:hypothetical protein